MSEIDKEVICDFIGTDCEEESVEGVEADCGRAKPSLLPSGGASRRKRGRPPGVKNRSVNSKDIRELLKKRQDKEGEESPDIKKRKLVRKVEGNGTDQEVEREEANSVMDEMSSESRTGETIMHGSTTDCSITNQQDVNAETGRNMVTAEEGKGTMLKTHDFVRYRMHANVDNQINLLKEIENLFNRKFDSLESEKEVEREEREKDRKDRKDLRAAFLKLEKMEERTSGDLKELKEKVEELDRRWKEEKRGREALAEDWRNGMEEKERVWKDRETAMEVEFRKQKELAESLGKGGGEAGDKGTAGKENEEIYILKRRMENDDRRRKRNNIIISGLELERIEDVTDWLRRKFETETTPVRSLRMRGKETRWGLELESEKIKEEIMRKKKDLKGSKVFIDNDLTWEERRTMSMIREEAARLKEEGKKVRIGYIKLIVNGETWAWNEKTGKFFRKVAQ